MQEPLHTTIINAYELYKGAFKSKKDSRAELAKVDALLDVLFLLAFDRQTLQRPPELSTTSPIR